MNNIGQWLFFGLSILALLFMFYTFGYAHGKSTIPKHLKLYVLQGELRCTESPMLNDILDTFVEDDAALRLLLAELARRSENQHGSLVSHTTCPFCGHNDDTEWVYGSGWLE